MPRDGFSDDSPSVRGRRLRTGLYAAALTLGAAAVATITSAAGWLLTISASRAWPTEAAAIIGGLGLGVLLGGRLSGPSATLSTTLRRLAAVLGMAAVASVAAAALSASAARLVGALDAGPEAGAAILGLLLLMPPSLCAGAALAILLKLAVDERPLERGPALGSMLCCCAIGGFGGTILSGGLALPRFGAAGTVTGAGLAFAALALTFALADPYGARRAPPSSSAPSRRPRR